MRDEVNEPLRKNPKPGADRFPAAVAALIVIATGLAGALMWRYAGDGAAPVAVALIEGQGKPTPAPSPATPTEVTAVASGEQVEKSSGVKVTRNGGGGPPGALIIDVPAALGVRLSPAPDPRLVENSKFGPLPRIGADGARPADVYARPAIDSVKLRGAPRIAILVGGLGLDEAGTRSAIERLPSPISLGFAPYGAHLGDLAASAREAGHEILLQAPMENFAAVAPSQHALIVAASEAENRDQLRWMMGRFPGFVGVSNYLGAKFTSDSKAYSPVLAELQSRGLLYVDDGSSPRSLTATLAPGLDLRAAQADVIIDATPTAEAIEIALGKLEVLARRQTSAIGVATALPLSIEHIAPWADALAARGIALTPISALVVRGAFRSAGATP